MCAYNADGKDLFSALANAEHCKYRIMRKGNGVTARYEKRSPTSLE